MSLPPSSEYMWWVEGLCSGGGSGPCWFSSRYLCQLISIWMAGRPLHASSMGERRCCLNTSVRSSWFRLAVLVSESFRGPFGPTVSGFGPTDSRCVLVGWVFSVGVGGEQVTNRSRRSCEGRKELNPERCSHSQTSSCYLVSPAPVTVPGAAITRWESVRCVSVCVCVRVCVCVDIQLVPPASLWM